MSREEIIQKTLHTLKVLPDDKLKEVLDFSDFVLKKYEEVILQQGIQKLQGNSETFSFLNEEENLYSLKDIKEKF
jgi:hypothetical protein